MLIVCRFFRFAYPVVVFLSLLVAWVCVGYFSGFADFREPHFDSTLSNPIPSLIQSTETQSRKDEISEITQVIES